MQLLLSGLYLKLQGRQLFTWTKEITEFAFEVEHSRQASLYLKKRTYEDFTYQREDNVVLSNIPTDILLVMPQEMPTASIGAATTNTRGRARTTHRSRSRSRASRKIKCL
jgi:hypothetical protein